jgi:hypothetical protein
MKTPRALYGSTLSAPLVIKKERRHLSWQRERRVPENQMLLFTAMTRAPLPLS